MLRISLLFDRSGSLFLVALVSVGIAAADVAGAQQPAPSAGTVDELTVTARKKAENLQSVPIAISAFGSEQLQLRDIVDLNRLADQTPGLSFATAGSVVNRRAVIRGMSQQTRVGDETNVASFIDGVYTPGFSGAEFFGYESLERIEVVKGPQSALYGRNSFAGAINYITAKPDYEFDYGGQLTWGDSERRGLSAYVSGPIVGEELALRVDGGFNRSGGTFDNQFNGRVLGSTDTGFVRFNLRGDYGDNMRVNASLSWQEDESEPVPLTQVADDDPNRVGFKTLFFYSPFELSAGGGTPLGRVYSGAIDDQSATFSVDPRAYAGDREILRASFGFERDFSAVTFVGLVGYQQRKVDTLGDFNTCRPETRAAVCDNVDPNGFGTYFAGPLAGGAQIVNILTGSVEDRRETSLDLRLQSNTDARLQWSTGIYLSREDFKDQSQRLSDGTLTNPDASNVYAVASPVPLTDSTTLNENEFYSIYGSLSYDFSERWNATLEARETLEKKVADNVEDVWPTQTPPTGRQSDDWTFFTPRLIVNYMPGNDWLLYASAAKGVKSGGFNPGAPELPVYKQEENWTYELGSKLTFWDGRARLNGAIYHVDWDNQQITGVAADGRTPITVNVAETEIDGIELEAFVNPTEWLSFNAGYTLLDAEYTRGIAESVANLEDCDAVGLPCDKLGPVGPVTSGDITGRKVIGTPESTFNAGVTVTLPLARSDWEFLGRIDYSWQDKQFIDEANSGFIPSRTTVNLRLGMQSHNWGFQGYCNNLTDDDTPLFALPPRDILGVPHYFVVNRDGRMCGLQASYRH